MGKGAAAAGSHDHEREQGSLRVLESGRSRPIPTLFELVRCAPARQTPCACSPPGRAQQHCAISCLEKNIQGYSCHQSRATMGTVVATVGTRGRARSRASSPAVRREEPTAQSPYQQTFFLSKDPEPSGFH